MTREMKNSGIPWIGEIPEGWTIELIGNQVKEVNNPNTNGEEDNALQFKMGSIISKSQGNSKYNPETLEGYNIVDKGVIMLNGLNLSFDLISQRVGLVRERGVITSTYLAVKPTDNIDSEYLTYLFKAYDNCKAFHSMGKGLRQTLSYGELRKYLLIYPSLAEQQRIAEFLDRKCAEVDEMIALQEQIIEELKAYKQSVITEAVTKGLNPDVPMKDSGSLWIGEIPTNWNLTRIGDVGEYKKGPFGSAITLDMFVPKGEHTIKVYEQQNAIKKDWTLGYYYLPVDYFESCLKGFEVLPNDIIVSCAGTIGEVYQLPMDVERGIINQALMRMRINSTINLSYFLYIFDLILKREAERSSNGTAIKNIPPFSIFKKILVPLPSLEEQQEIADYLDDKCADIDSLIQTKQSKIDSLKEYKKSIIYEYVTGKREVNE